MGSFGTKNRYRSLESGKLDGSLVKVYFAQNAESYGCKAQQVSVLESPWLHPGPTLLDIRVLPKIMTYDYKAQWRTGDAQAPRSSSVTQSAEQTLAKLRSARQY